MSLNPAGTGYGWNFSRPDKENYSEQLIGTVVSMQEVQAREYKPGGGVGKAKFWDDGNPVMNIRIGVATPDGSFKTVTFSKAGKKQVAGEKPSLHVQLWNLVNRGNFENLMGKTVQITTWPANPTTGQTWGQGNPRLFDVQEVPGVTFQLNGHVPAECLVPELLANDAASGGQSQQPITPMATVTTPVVPVNIPTTAVTQQPVVQAQQQPSVQAQQQQMQAVTTATMPQGMDPAVAAAMTTLGATNIQPMQTDVYDDSLPF